MQAASPAPTYSGSPARVSGRGPSLACISAGRGGQLLDQLANPHTQIAGGADQAAYQTSHTISNSAAKVVIARTRSRTTAELATAFRVSSTGSEGGGGGVILVPTCRASVMSRQNATYAT